MPKNIPVVVTCCSCGCTETFDVSSDDIAYANNIAVMSGWTRFHDGEMLCNVCKIQAMNSLEIE